ncbi:hypothetical protein HUJ05_005607 [Dendroctonus ponderosae]|nr:hypothetical protein HUJ05_005607 [Dendroctonus ponderosae]
MLDAIESKSRKRRPSASQDDSLHPKTAMDECSAALVLMSLSCSPQNDRANPTLKIDATIHDVTCLHSPVCTYK